MVKLSTKKEVLSILKNKKGIHLDVGCGQRKQKNFVGLDIRPLPGVDIVWNMEKIPYPLPDDCCISILASHVVEHINPNNFGFINVMNEWHRIMVPSGRLMIAMPYGVGFGFVQDPTHVNPCNEITWAYFDPTHPSGLYAIYTPNPWKIVVNSFKINGTMEVILEKIPKDEVVVDSRGIIVDKKWATVSLKAGGKE